MQAVNPAITTKAPTQANPQSLAKEAINKLGKEFTTTIKNANLQFTLCNQISDRERGYHPDAEAHHKEGIKILNDYFSTDAFKTLLAKLTPDAKIEMKKLIMTQLNDKSLDLQNTLKKYFG
jgi:hypothetical protein